MVRLEERGAQRGEAAAAARAERLVEGGAGGAGAGAGEGPPASSRTVCRLPSSPNVPCTAGNATARLAARCDAREAGSGKNVGEEDSSPPARPRSLKSKSLGVLLYICFAETACARSARSK